jgi:hypothetical protein
MLRLRRRFLICLPVLMLLVTAAMSGGAWKWGG